MDSAEATLSEEVILCDHLLETYGKIDATTKQAFYIHGLWSSGKLSAAALIKACAYLGITLTVVTVPPRFPNCNIRPKKLRELSLHDTVETIKLFVQAKGIQDYTVIGHSSGGAVAQLLLSDKESGANSGLLLCSTTPYIPWQGTVTGSLLRGILWDNPLTYLPAIFWERPYHLQKKHREEFGGKTGELVWKQMEYGDRTRNCIPIPLPGVGKWLAQHWGWGFSVEPIPLDKHVVIVGAVGDRMTPWKAQRALARFHGRALRGFDSCSHTEILNNTGELKRYVKNTVCGNN